VVLFGVERERVRVWVRVRVRLRVRVWVRVRVTVRVKENTFLIMMLFCRRLSYAATSFCFKLSFRALGWEKIISIQN
jgi:hypothetical protein